jgi:uncharacterized protein (DUF1800 family)
MSEALPRDPFSTTAREFDTTPFGTETFGTDPFGRDALGTDFSGSDALGAGPSGQNALDRTEPATGQPPMRPRRDRQRLRTEARTAETTEFPAAEPEVPESGGAEAGRAEVRRAARRRTTPASPIPGVSRRNLLLSGAAAVAAASGTGTLLLTGANKAAPTLVNASTTGTTGLNPATQLSSSQTTAAAKKPGFALPKKLDPDLLISRATYGRTVTVEHDVHRLGPTAWLQRQLAASKLKDPGGAAVAKLYPRLSWSATSAHKKLKQGDWALMQDTVAAHLGRAIFSTRQLNEVMVDFWSNHLNIQCPNGDIWDTRHRYQIDVIRKHALGSFEAMLLASAVHPSMLIYLDGANSTGQYPNENYAREVLELHTVGVDGGYTERDIQKSALLLTGWTVMNGIAKYDPNRHYVGKVKAFGHTEANHSASKGRTGQRAYLKYLAHHPKTAHRIALKLAQRFVSDSPPKSLVTKLAASYKKHDTQIVPVLRELFASPEFAASAGEKIRRPMEVVVANARVIGVKLGHNVKGLGDLANTLNDMGHVPLGWAMPNGYADIATSWQSPASALAQFNETATIVQGWWPTTLVLPGPKKLLTKPPRTRNGVIDAVAKKTLGRKPTSREKSAAHTLLAGTKLPSSFGAGSWEQQQTIALTTTLLLASPAHLTR